MIKNERSWKKRSQGEIYLMEHREERKPGTNQRGSAGFTLLELIVVLVIMAILLGLGGWALMSWREHSVYLQNEETAKTIFLATQSGLSAKDANGVLDDTLETLEEAAGDNVFSTAEEQEKVGILDENNTKKDETGKKTGKDDEGNTHTYASIVIPKGYYEDHSKTALFRLIEPFISDTSVLNSAMVVEFDLTAKNVYAVFYSGWEGDFSYSEGESSKRGTYYIHETSGDKSTRDPDDRRSCLIGYYSTQDQTNMAVLGVTQLRFTRFALNNEETLNVTFGSKSSKASNDLDVKYTFDLYNAGSMEKETKDGKAVPAAEIVFDYRALGLGKKPTGAAVDSKPDSGWYLLPWTDEEDLIEQGYTAENAGQWHERKFYIAYDEATQTSTLYLDTVMSDNLQGQVYNLYRVKNDTDYLLAAENKKYGASITDLLGKTPKDIYVIGTAGKSDNTDIVAEFGATTQQSKTHNDLFADEITVQPGNGKQTLGIRNNRHFSNMRFYQTPDETVFPSSQEDLVAAYYKGNDALSHYLKKISGLFSSLSDDEQAKVTALQTLLNQENPDRTTIKSYVQELIALSQQKSGSIEYQLQENLDWDRAQVMKGDSPTGEWTITDGKDTVFPMISAIGEKVTVDGAQNSYANLQLSPDSAMFLAYSEEVKADNGKKEIGLIGENSGAIEDLALKSATLTTEKETEETKKDSPEAGDSDTGKDKEAGEKVEYTFPPKQASGGSYTAAGLLCAVNTGSIEGISFDESCAVGTKEAPAEVTYDEKTTASQGCGIGMVSGVMNLDTDEKQDVVVQIKTQGSVYGKINVSGDVEFTVNSLNGARKNENTSYKYAGIGSIAGYLHTTRNKDDADGLTGDQVKVAGIGAEHTYAEEITSSVSGLGTHSIVNSADVTGNMFTGGIVGNVNADLKTDDTDTTNDLKAQQQVPQIYNCLNEGVVSTYKNPDAKKISTEGKTETYSTLEGFFIGGIAGYNYQSCISESMDAVAKEKTAAFTDTSKDTGAKKAEDQKHTVAYNAARSGKGYFVGGITGMTESGYLYNCSTKKGGYITGYDYVGGISGSLKGSAIQLGSTATNNQEVSTLTSASTAITNASYVLGHSYVGGIVGSNGAGSVIEQCRNDGVAAGYGIDIGGIAGRNEGRKAEGKEEQKDVLATIRNCSGSLNDYGNTQYRLISETWQMYGDNVGGQVGYNEYGEVTYDNDTYSKFSHSVSAIAVGNNNVGGYVGFNGIHGTVTVKNKNGEKNQSESFYVSGTVSGTGDAVGGYIGLNLSPSVFIQKDDSDASGISAQSFNITAREVKGDELVGGVIGANLVDVTDSELSEKLRQGITNLENCVPMSLKNSNSLGTISGRKLVGGVIGYSAVVKKAEQSGNTQDQAAAKELSDLSLVTLKEKAEAEKKDLDWASAFLTQENALYSLNTEETGLTTDTDYTFVIGSTGSKGGESSDLVPYNKARVEASALAAGILGMNDPDSKLIIHNVQNEGRVSEITGSADERISLSTLVGDEDLNDTKTALIGGIVSFNTKNSVIDNCANRAVLTTQSGGAGSVAGVNNGYIVNCDMLQTLSQGSSDYIGGIAAINFDSTEVAEGEEEPKNEIKEKSANGNDTLTYTFYPGTIEDCRKGESTQGGTSYTVGGNNTVGGIAALNYRKDKDAQGGLITGCLTSGSVTGVGENIGGLVGTNQGGLEILGTRTFANRTLKVTGAGNVGGAAGVNSGNGSIGVATDDSVDSYTGMVTVTADENNAGGLVGYLKSGSIEGTKDNHIENLAVVTAQDSYAGGIAGRAHAGSVIRYADNREAVTAATNYAGGICGYNMGKAGTAEDESRITEDSVIDHCANYADVTSVSGDASGIAPKNDGQILDCAAVSGTLTSGTETIGAITNENNGSVLRCTAAVAGTQNNTNNASAATVTLTDPNAQTIGYLVGTNNGTVYGGNVGSGAKLGDRTSPMTLGGFVGRNTENGTVGASDDLITDNESNATRSTQELNFSGIACVGGLVGDNQGTVQNVTFAGTLEQKSGANIEDCYGGIAGKNTGTVKGSRLSGATVKVVGEDTVDASQSAADKIANASLTGGIVGSNAKDKDTKATGTVQNCYLDGDANLVEAQAGMLGGIVGANVGTVEHCGSETSYGSGNSKISAMDLMQEFKTAYENGDEDARYQALTELTDKLTNDKTKTKYTQLKGTETETNQTVITMRYGSALGYMGGIVGFNSTTGTVSQCASGKWFVYGRDLNEASSIGGVIGQNESEAVVSFDLNCAYVERTTTPAAVSEGYTGKVYNPDYIEASADFTQSTREYKTGTIKLRYVGGVIGDQQNRTSSNWVVDGCVNYGDVEDYNANNVGGIIARWRNNGGTLSRSMNYGKMIANVQTDWAGTVGGVVGYINNPTSGQDINVVSCQNHGTINPFTFYGSNDNAGIVAEINASSDLDQLTVNITDCVNSEHAKVYAWSMADGILAWVGGSDSKDKNIQVNIDRCRNYSNDLYTCNNDYSATGPDKRSRTAGIFGTRNTTGDIKSTKLTNCFSVLGRSTQQSEGSPLADVTDRGGDRASILKGSSNNYYMDYWSFYYKTGSLNSTPSRWPSNVQLQGQEEAYPFNGMVGARRLYASTNATEQKAGVKDYYKAILPANQVSLGKLNSKNAYIIPSTDPEGYGTVKYRTYGEWKTAGEIKLKYTETGKVSGLDYTDVTDEALHDFYQDVLEGDNLKYDQPDVTVTRSNGKFDLSWSMSDTSNVLSYLMETYIYRVKKGVKIEGTTTPAKAEDGAPVVTTADGSEIVRVDQNGNVLDNDAAAITNTFYQTKGTFQMNEKWSSDETYDYYFIFRVKPQGSNSNANKNSEWGYARFAEDKNSADSNTYLIKGQKVLPTPEIEVIRRSKRESSNGKYTENGNEWYLHLTNYTDYTDDQNVEIKYYIRDTLGAEDNLQSFDAAQEWQSIGDITTFNPDKNVMMSRALVFYAKPKGDNSDYMNSAQQSPLVCLWNLGGSPYNADGDKTGYFNPNSSITAVNSKFVGTTVDNVSYQTTLKFGNNYNSAAQKFRVEVVGTETKGSHVGRIVTLASREVSLAKNIETPVTVDGLPKDLLENYSNIHAEAWYSSPGVGPVYTHYELAQLPDLFSGENNTRKNGYVINLEEKDGKAFYTYEYSNVLDKNDMFTGYNYLNDVGGKLEVLAKPSNLRIEKSDDLAYTFSWNPVKNASGYQVSLYGLKMDESGKETSRTKINTDTEYPAGSSQTSFTINADTWTYDKVELSVTAKGSGTASGGTLTIGQTSTETFDVMQRLPRVGAPTASLVSQDGLQYQLSWTGISSRYQDVCEGYRVYMMVDGESDPVCLSKDASGNEMTVPYGTNTLTVDLDDYAGKDVKIYVVAVAKSGSTRYIDSLPGDTLDLTLLDRLEQPEVTFKWSIDSWKDSSATESDFTSSSSKLVADITRAEGRLDGSYLISGLIYKNEKEAQDALDELNGLSSKTTPDTYNSEVLKLVRSLVSAADQGDDSYSFGMQENGTIIGEYISSSDDGTVHSYTMPITDLIDDWSIKYAGYYVIPLVRSSTNTGVTSVYAWQDTLLQLPKVKFDSPAISKSYETSTLTGNAYKVENFNEQPDQEITTKNIALDTYSWSRSDDYPDAYSVQMNTAPYHVDSESGSMVQGSRNWNFRIQTDLANQKLYLYLKSGTTQTDSSDEDLVTNGNAVRDGLQAQQEKLSTKSSTKTTDGEYTAYQKVGGTDEAWTVRTQSTTIGAVTETTTSYYRGATVTTVTNKDDSVTTTVEKPAGAAAYVQIHKTEQVTNSDGTTSTREVYTAYTDGTGSTGVVVAAITDGRAELTVPESNNDIYGSVIYGNVYASYLFHAKMNFVYRRDGDQNTYTWVMPSTSDGFDFNLTDSEGTSYTANASASAPYAQDLYITTRAEKDSRQYTDSDQSEK